VARKLIPDSCVRKHVSVEDLFVCAVKAHKDSRALIHVAKGGRGTGAQHLLLERMMKQAKVAARKRTAAHRSQMRVAQGKVFRGED
jgi:hypothetical protein